MIEVWRDQKAADAHEIGAHTKDFRKVLGSATGALYDQALVPGTKRSEPQASSRQSFRPARRNGPRG